MAAETSKKHDPGSSEAADDETQQIRLIDAPPPARQAEIKADAASATGEGGVPQETVPMPVAEWHAAAAAAAAQQAPTKPPPVARPATKERGAGAATVTRQVEAVPRAGVLTSELRRALPPWALPLLDSQPVTVWIGARIGLTVLAFLAGLMLPGLDPKGTANWYGSPGGPPLTGFVDRIGGVWTRWDGQWYLKIATEGYHRDDGSAAFFPLFPWILQIVGWLAAERYIWAGILLSSLFFLGALILLHRLVRLDFHPEDAGRTTFYLAAFPMAFFFWAIYSESLFLLLAVATLLAARTHRFWWAAVAVSLAIWTRTAGILLILPLAWELWRAYHPPMPKDPRAMPPARPSQWALPSLALPALSLFGLLAWAWAEFGSPFASLAAQTDWNRHFSWPWQTIGSAFQAATSMPFQFQPEDQSWTYLGALILALVLGALSIRWLRGSYSIYLWAGILFPLFSATPHNPLLSYPRFLVVLFPIFIVLALMGRNRYAHQIITWSSLLLLALYTIRFANWYWVA